VKFSIANKGFVLNIHIINVLDYNLI